MNNKLLNIFFTTGATMLLISSVLVMEKVVWGKYTFAIGVALFVITRTRMTYIGSDFRLKRLNRLYFFSSVLLVIAVCLQFRENGLWILLLLVVAISEFYTSMRVSYYEKSNAAKKNKSDSDESSSENALEE